MDLCTVRLSRVLTLTVLQALSDISSRTWLLQEAHGAELRVGQVVPRSVARVRVVAVLVGVRAVEDDVVDVAQAPHKLLRPVDGAGRVRAAGPCAVAERVVHALLQQAPVRRDVRLSVGAYWREAGQESPSARGSPASNTYFQYSWRP